MVNFQLFNVQYIIIQNLPSIKLLKNGLKHIFRYLFIKRQLYLLIVLKYQDL